MYFKKKIRAHRCGWKPSSRSHWSNKKGCTWKHWWNPCGIRDPPKILRKNAVSPFGAWLAVFFFFGGVMAELSHAVVSFQKCRVALEHRREWIIVGWISPGWFFPVFVGSFSESKKNRTSCLEGQKKRSAQPSDVLTNSRLFFLLLNFPRLLQNSKVKNLD